MYALSKTIMFKKFVLSISFFLSFVGITILITKGYVTLGFITEDTNCRDIQIPLQKRGYDELAQQIVLYYKNSAAN